MKYEDVLSFWRKKNITNANELSVALDSQSVLFAYNSGKIENDNITYNDTREIFDKDGVVLYTGDLRTLYEIRNAKDAYNLLLDVFDIKADLDSKLLCKFQYEFTKNTYDERRWALGERPGKFKRHDYIIGKNETGALPEDVSKEVDELLHEIKISNNSNALIASAYFHCKFENIHPFSDGNGRTGRILTNYILLKNNFPPVTIYEEDRKEYYKALECWDEFQDLEIMIKFLKEQTIKTWDKQLKRVEEKDKKDGEDDISEKQKKNICR